MFAPGTGAGVDFFLGVLKARLWIAAALGFLALALSALPPMREFGIVSAPAFLLALAADFTALPGALWILDRSSKIVRLSRVELIGDWPDG